MKIMRRVALVSFGWIMVLAQTAALCHAAEPKRGQDPGNVNLPKVKVRIIDRDGKLTGPVEMPKLVLTDAQWARLTPEQYRITRGKMTEPAFCGDLLHNKQSGVYVCVCCDLPLFASGTKFKSGTGWPSFFQPVAPENISQRPDYSYGTVRMEILCTRCGALGARI